MPAPSVRTPAPATLLTICTTVIVMLLPVELFALAASRSTRVGGKTFGESRRLRGDSVGNAGRSAATMLHAHKHSRAMQAVVRELRMRSRDICPSCITFAAYCAEKEELPRWCQGRPRWMPRRVHARIIGGLFRGSRNLSRVQNSLFRVERACRRPESAGCQR
eukprot:scaffold5726_cov116-Isochrysis_galbana.AAC.2